MPDTLFTMKPSRFQNQLTTSLRVHDDFTLVPYDKIPSLFPNQTKRYG